MIEHKLLLALQALSRRGILALLTFVVTLLVAANSLFGKVRMSHENGILLRGRLRIVDQPDFAAHPFFVAGAAFTCRLRHAAASFVDDAKVVMRSASIKFADARTRWPFDFLMNSGRVPLFWNVRSLVEFMRVTIAGRGKYFVPYPSKRR